MPLSIIFWIIVLVLTIILEAATANLVSIWFSAGAVAAIITAVISPENYLLQTVLFIVVSGLVLLLLRPLVKKYIKPAKQPTNCDRYIGQTAVVTEEINNTLGTGRATIDGKDWSARSEDGSIISQQKSVTVIRIDGVKLIVKE